MRNKLLKILSIIIVFSVFILPSESYPQTEKTYGLAVLDLEGNNIAEAEAKALSDVLRSSINKILLEKSGKVQESYELLERSQMDNIFDQFDVQNTGCTDLSCAIEFGKMLNVDRIIIGSVSLIGSTYMVIARIVDVESSKTIVSVDRKQRGIIDNVIDLMPVVGHELLTGEHLTAPVPAALSPSTTVKTPAVPADSRQVQRQQEQYVSVSGTPSGAVVTIKGKKIGEAPVDNYIVPEGSYKVKVSSPGYENYIETVYISRGSPAKISYHLKPKTKQGVLKRSIFLPGSGQRYAEYRGKGNFITILQLAAIGGAVAASLNAGNAWSEYDDVEAAYKNAVPYDDFNSMYKNLDDKHKTASSAGIIQKSAIAAAAAVYLYNIIDALMTEPKTDVRFPANAINITPDVTGGYAGLIVNVRF